MASLSRSDFSSSSFPLCSDFEAAGKTRGIAEMGTKLSAAISAATTEPRSKPEGNVMKKSSLMRRCAKRVKSTRLERRVSCFDPGKNTH